MSPRDTLSALLAATVWGLTFVAIKFGVGEAPPFLLTALRFAFAAVPAVFFIKPPAATPALVILYGLLIGVGQFGLLFVAFGLGMSVGLASVVMQMQAFFTILLAWAFMGERPTRQAELGHDRHLRRDRRDRGGAVRRRELLAVRDDARRGLLLGSRQYGRQARGARRSARLHGLVEPRRAGADVRCCR